jgi:hypothetical protein
MIKPNWRWTKDIEDVVLQEITKRSGPVVHVCSGSSGIGDVRIDKWFGKVEKRRCSGQPNIRADYRDLPIKTGSAAVTICDPPYSPTKHGKHLPIVLGELIRITAPGGLLIWVCPWIPFDPVLELLKLFLRPIKPHPSYKIVSVSRKKEWWGWLPQNFSTTSGETLPGLLQD